MIEYKMEGMEQLQAYFEQIATEVTQGKVLWGSLRAAAVVIQKEAIKNAQKIDAPKRPNDPVDSKIYPSIAVQKSKKLAEKIGGAAYRVGVRGTAAYSTREPPTYWRFVETGTKYTRAQPFLRPALSSSIMIASDEFAAQFRKRIYKALDQTPKRKPRPRKPKA